MSARAMTHAMTVTTRAILLLPLLLLASCPAPRATPEQTCAKACTERARYQCTDGECERGCRVALDRFVEKHGDDVVACVAREKNRKCDDLLWADCAARLGVHADGGPPVPTLKSQDEDEE